MSLCGGAVVDRADLLQEAKEMFDEVLAHAEATDTISQPIAWALSETAAYMVKLEPRRKTDED